MSRAQAFNIPVTAERLTAYAVERQHETAQQSGASSRTEQRRFWTDAILQGMTRLEGRQPAPELMAGYDQRLEAAQGSSAVEPLLLEEQTALIHDLSRYIAALEATGDDRRRQIAVVGDLLGDMVASQSWGLRSNGLFHARQQAESTLLHMTAQMPIRFTRVLLGGDYGPCESDFVSGAVMDAETVRETALYKRMTQQNPEITEWPAICTIYVGRGLDFAHGTVDATEFDLSIMREVGDWFLKRPGIRAVNSLELRVPACEHIRVLKVEPGAAPEAVTMPNMLEAFQEAVGGCIEALGMDAGFCLICNEKGKLLGLPANRRVGNDVVAGTFLIAGEADGEFCSLSDEDLAYYAEQFAEPMLTYDGQGEPTQWEFYVL